MYYNNLLKKHISKQYEKNQSIQRRHIIAKSPQRHSRPEITSLAHRRE